MPRKSRIQNTDNKNSLMNSIVKNGNKEENIILQLPLTQNKINSIINKNIEDIIEPLPYEPNCCFLNNDNLNNFNFNNDDNLNDNDNNDLSNKNICCFWCCHHIDYKLYGMPINYDSINDNYLIYGSFCSLQCANAYNFSMHTGSDKVWEINSLIQMMSKRYGVKDIIRPAPSRYLLKMFNGVMDIEEFRNAHKTNDNTHILNLPPMISITSGYDNINTSYLTKK